MSDQNKKQPARRPASFGSSKNGKRSGFLIQAGILAAAGIICRIIGLLYRSPLTSIIGDEGNGYYSQGYNIYNIILLISSYSIPLAISKVVSAKLALKEYKNAHRVFQCALIYVVIVGSIASLFAFFGAPFLVDGSSAMLVLRILAPTIFFSGLLGVFRGYFQAHGSMVQTSISQILEQILNAVVSIGAAHFFTQLCLEKLGSESEVATYGAAGSALGTGAGVLTGLLFMLLVFWLNYPYFKRRRFHTKNEKVDSYGTIFKSLLLLVTPVIFSTFIYNLSTTLDMKVYMHVMEEVKGWSVRFTNSQYGIFSTKYMVIINIPIAIASSISSAMIPGVSGCYAKNELEATKNKVQEVIRFTMFLAIPSAIGLIVLAYPVMSLLFSQPESLITAASLLRWGGICTVFYCLSTVSNGILQAIGAMNKPVKNAFLALILHMVFLLPLLYFTNWNLYALIVGAGSYSLIMCILNAFSVRKCLHFKQDIKKTFLLPGAAALVMGVIVWAVYHGTYAVLKTNFISLMLSICLGASVYFVFLILFGAVTKDELSHIPKGNILVSIGEKLHLFRS